MGYVVTRKEITDGFARICFSYDANDEEGGRIGIHDQVLVPLDVLTAEGVDAHALLDAAIRARLPGAADGHPAEAALASFK